MYPRWGFWNKLINKNNYNLKEEKKKKRQCELLSKQKIDIVLLLLVNCVIDLFRDILYALVSFVKLLSLFLHICISCLHYFLHLFFSVVQMGEEYFHAKDYNKALM